MSDEWEEREAQKAVDGRFSPRRFLRAKIDKAKIGVCVTVWSTPID
jgi:hypothetical protein